MTFIQAVHFHDRRIRSRVICQFPVDVAKYVRRVWFETDAFEFLLRWPRHWGLDTAKRVFDRPRDEHGFAGGYTIIKDYMRDRDRRDQEMFVPLAHPAGHGQADFGEAVVVIGGVEQKAHRFVLDLPHSDVCYVRAYPAAVAEAWVDGHV